MIRIFLQNPKGVNNPQSYFNYVSASCVKHNENVSHLGFIYLPWPQSIFPFRVNNLPHAIKPKVSWDVSAITAFLPLPQRNHKFQPTSTSIKVFQERWIGNHIFKFFSRSGFQNWNFFLCPIFFFGSTWLSEKAVSY